MNLIEKHDKNGQRKRETTPKLNELANKHEKIFIVANIQIKANKI